MITPYWSFLDDDYGYDCMVMSQSSGEEEEFIIILATHRYRLNRDDLPPKVPFDSPEWMDRRLRVGKMAAESGTEPIGLRHDGERRVCRTPLDCAVELEYLKRLGYRIPQELIDDLREEDRRRHG